MEKFDQVEYEQINLFLTGIFNRVLSIEEESLKDSHFSDLTIKEMHTIDAIGEQNGSKASEIAQTLMVTISTVTTSLNHLEAKGYIRRVQSDEDRRVYHVVLTKKGNIIYRAHRHFHKKMVDRFVFNISQKDTEILKLGLKNLYDFLEESLNKEKNRKK
jgi:DNA-binding MarR family transcriptional regulator